MKIVLLTDNYPPYHSGGAELVAANCASAFAAYGHEVTVITTTQDVACEGSSYDGQVHIIHLYAPKYHQRWRHYFGLWSPRITRELKNHLASICPDVVSAHNIHYYLSYHALKIAKKSHAFVVLTAHDFMLYSYGKVDDEYRVSSISQLKENKFRYNPLRNIIIRYYLRFVDQVVAVSYSLKEALQNNGIKNVAVIHNGVNLAHWEAIQADVNSFRAGLGITNKKSVFFAGRLSEAKGGEHIIRAMAEVIRDFPESVLLIAGQQNRYTDNMLLLAKELNIYGHIIFTGWLDRRKLALAYHGSEVVVFPSIYPDPFGMVNAEAMACAKPVVASCFGGAKEIVQNGITGFIVNPFDASLMAGRIKKLLADNNLALRMGEAGYERVKDLFTAQRQGKEYLKLFGWAPEK